jgi:hypothetical protein
MDLEKLTSAIEDCLNFYDPQGCIAMGSPLDEYRGEAKMIAEGFLNLPSKHSIQLKVYNVFREQFGDWLAGSAQSYEPIAEDLFNLKHTFGKTYKVR